MTIKVSIIIPIYNTEKYLKQCLDSVVNQTLKEIEIICIDDKSTDNSLKILREYKEQYDKDNKIIIVEQPSNQGQGVARNKGIEIAKGEYIGFVDSDDFVSLNYFEELYNRSIKYNVNLVKTCNNVIVNDKNQEKKIKLRYSKFNHLLNINKDNILNFSWTVWSSLYKKEFINRYNIIFPKLNFAEDLYFNELVFSYLYENNKKLYITNRVRYYYRYNINSTTHSKKEIDIASNEIQIIGAIYEEYKNRNLLNKLPLILSLIRKRFIRSKIKDKFYNELRYLFKKIEQDKLVVWKLYNNKIVDFYRNIISNETYEEYQANEDFMKAKFLGIPIARLFELPDYEL